MKVAVIDGSLHYNGGVYTVGAVVDLEETEARRLIELKIARGVDEPQPVPDEPKAEPEPEKIQPATAPAAAPRKEGKRR